MKHHLSAVRRSPWLSVFCIVLLAFVFSPALVMAAPLSTGLPLANVGGWNPVMMGGLGAGVIALGLRNKLGKEGSENGGETEALDPLNALAQVEDKTLPLSQRLSVAAQALRGIDPTGQLATVKQSLADAQAALSAKEAALTDLQAKFAAQTKELEARQTDVTALEASNAALETEKAALQAKEQDLEKRAEAKSKEKLASLGFAAEQLPGQTSEMAAELPANEQKLEEALKACGTQQERSNLLRSYQEAQGKKTA